MSVLNKNQLLTERLSAIYPNLNNEISANMVGNFIDTFIESIWFYTDDKWGNLEVYDLTKIGINGQSNLDFGNRILDFTSTNSRIRHNGNDKLLMTNTQTTINNELTISGFNLSSTADPDTSISFLEDLFMSSDNNVSISAGSQINMFSGNRIRLDNLEITNNTTLRNITNTGTFIGLTNDLNLNANNNSTINAGNTLNISTTNQMTYSANNHVIRINTPTPVNKMLIDILDISLNGNTSIGNGNLTITNGDVSVNGDITSKKNTSTEELDIQGIVNVDGDLGISGTFVIGSPLLNRSLEVKNGIVIGITEEDGWDVQIDCFNQVTTNPIPNLTIDIYPNQTQPPVGNPVASFTTNSIGRVEFKSNPESTYRLHIYGGIYDDIYPLLEVDANPTLRNYELMPTG